MLLSNLKYTHLPSGKISFATDQMNSRLTSHNAQYHGNTESSEYSMADQNDTTLG